MAVAEGHAVTVGVIMPTLKLVLVAVRFSAVLPGFSTRVAVSESVLSGAVKRRLLKVACPLVRRNGPSLELS